MTLGLTARGNPVVIIVTAVCRTTRYTGPHRGMSFFADMCSRSDQKALLGPCAGRCDGIQVGSDTATSETRTKTDLNNSAVG